MASLEGNYRPEHVFALQPALELYDVCQEKIAACDEQTEQVLGSMVPEHAPTRLPPAPRSRRKPRGNEPRFEIGHALNQISP